MVKKSLLLFLALTLLVSFVSAGTIVSYPEDGKWYDHEIRSISFGSELSEMDFCFYNLNGFEEEFDCSDKEIFFEKSPVVENENILIVTAFEEIVASGGIISEESMISEEIKFYIDTFEPSKLVIRNFENSKLMNKKIVNIKYAFEEQNPRECILIVGDATQVNEYIQNELNGGCSGSFQDIPFIEGVNDVWFFVEDYIGNKVVLEIPGIEVDATLPVINFEEETTEEGTYNQDSIFSKITASDANLNKVFVELLSVDGENVANWEQQPGGIVPIFYTKTLSDLGEGRYILKAYAEDDFGNKAYAEERQINLDLHAPKYSEVEKTDGLFQTSKEYFFEVIWEDGISSVEEVWITFNGVDYEAKKYPQLGFVTDPEPQKYYFSFDNLDIGNYAYSWHATDEFNQTNSTGDLIYDVYVPAPVPTPVTSGGDSTSWKCLEWSEWGECGSNNYQYGQCSSKEEVSYSEKTALYRSRECVVETVDTIVEEINFEEAEPEEILEEEREYNSFITGAVVGGLGKNLAKTNFTSALSFIFAAGLLFGASTVFRRNNFLKK